MYYKLWIRVIQKPCKDGLAYQIILMQQLHCPMVSNFYEALHSNLMLTLFFSSAGKTYFFKDNRYWLYNNLRVQPVRGYPRRASTAWLSCTTRTTQTPFRSYNTTVSFIYASSDSAAVGPSTSSAWQVSSPWSLRSLTETQTQMAP